MDTIPDNLGTVIVIHLHIVMYSLTLSRDLYPLTCTGRAPYLFTLNIKGRGDGSVRRIESIANSLTWGKIQRKRQYDSLSGLNEYFTGGREDR